MNEKIRALTGKKQLLILLLAGILLIVIALPTKTDDRETATAVPAEGELDEEAYVEGLEERLTEILEEMEGVGTVRVMITLSSSTEKIVEKDTDRTSAQVTEEDAQGGTRTSTDRTSSETTVYNEQDAGGQTPYVSKELTPKVEGVVVIADGGDNAVVVQKITEAVQALFGVDTHKIRVMKRNQT